MTKHLLFALFSIFITQSILAQNPINKKGWKLTFNDEFNAKKVDYTKWQNYYYWGGRFNKGGLTYYGENQFNFTDSTLLITAEKEETKKGLPYTSGMLDCNKYFKQKYGYFEIRTKIPKGTGFLPAFWLVSTEQWPPEIDIFELYSAFPNHLSTTQHWLNKKGHQKMQPKGYKIADASKNFHIYAVEWTPKKIIWYYDNKKIRSSRRGAKFFNYKMHIIINLQISTMKGMKPKHAIFPSNFEIDYVRVYKRK